MTKYILNGTRLKEDPDLGPVIEWEVRIDRDLQAIVDLDADFVHKVISLKWKERTRILITDPELLKNSREI